jgi:C1A family cysteine protease
MNESSRRGMGWLHEPADLRDFWIDFVSPQSRGKESIVKTKNMSLQYPKDPSRPDRLKDIAKSIEKLNFPFPPPVKHLSNVKWCSPIEDQLGLGSCTAQAGVGLLEYFERRTFGKHLDGSRLFLYKTTRNLLGWDGDRGAYCRTTMAAMALIGVALEKYWPYTEVNPDFDREPSSFVYALAQNYQGLLYHRADNVQSSIPLESRIKLQISLGWPLMFGFTCYESIWDTETTATGEIPYPIPAEASVGGHAIIAIGYDDNKKIKNPRVGGIETKGAFLIRNSWGTNWGCVPSEAPVGTTRGYGWLPYRYLSEGLASDWWTLIKAEWIDTGVFGI